MIFTQLCYGVIVATNMLAGGAIFSNGAPLNVNAATAAEVFEGINERAAAIGWPRTGSGPLMPFTVSEVSEAGYRFGTTLFASWNSANAYMLTNGTWKSWSFNPWMYPTEMDGEIYFLPWIGWSQSSFQWQQAAMAIERMAPYFVRSSTATSITAWTASDLWEAAGAPAGNPFAGASTFEDYQHVGTGKVWILYRAVANMQSTEIPGWMVAASNAQQNVYAVTNVVTPIELYQAGPRPDWVEELAGYPYFRLALTNAAVNLTNTVTGFAFAYTATNSFEPADVTELERILFSGYGDWSLYWSDAAGEDDDWYRAGVSNKTATARKTQRAYYTRIPELAEGVTAAVDFAFSATALVTLTNATLLSTNYWNTNQVSAGLSCHAVGTNWAGSASVTTDIPEVSSRLDLSAFSGTNAWNGAGQQSPPTITISASIAWSRSPIVRWTFSRCKPSP